MEWSLKVTCPASGLSRPEMMLNRVVLPAPLGPMTALIRPGFTWNETRFTATRPPKLRRTSFTSSNAMLRPPFWHAKPDRPRRRPRSRNRDVLSRTRTRTRRSQVAHVFHFLLPHGFHLSAGEHLSGQFSYPKSERLERPFRRERNNGDENRAEHGVVVTAEQAAERQVVQQGAHAGDTPEARHAAGRGQRDVTHRLERAGFRRPDTTGVMREEHAGHRREQRAQHEGAQFVGGGVDAHRTGGGLAVVDGLQCAADA